MIGCLGMCSQTAIRRIAAALHFAVKCRALPQTSSGDTITATTADRSIPFMTEPSPGTLPSATPPGDRLDSWKEIAAYLNRDVTTVQRWERREGMPVHRHLHDKVGSVYASRV